MADEKAWTQTVTARPTRERNPGRSAIRSISAPGATELATEPGDVRGERLRGATNRALGGGVPAA
jgi:hypothetical protein